MPSRSPAGVASVSVRTGAAAVAFEVISPARRSAACAAAVSSASFRAVSDRCRRTAATVALCPTTAASRRATPARAARSAPVRRTRSSASLSLEVAKPPRAGGSLDAQAPVLRRGARQPFDARHGLVEGCGTENDRDRVGLPVHVELSEQRSDALLGCPQGAANDCPCERAGSARCVRALRTARQAAPPRLSPARAPTRRRRAPAGPTSPSGRARLPVRRAPAQSRHSRATVPRW